MGVGRGTFLAAVIVLALGCAHGRRAVAKRTFSGAAAYERLQTLLALPRAPGHSRRERSIAALTEMMTAAGLEQVTRIEHEETDPLTHRSVPLVNLLGWFRPQAERVFVLATHFDTPPRAHEDPDPGRRQRPVPGANDGTSGLAVILELVPLLRLQLPEDVGFAVVLFDGEELGDPRFGGYMMGSRHVGELLRRGELPALARAELGIVLDMVGDVNLELTLDPASETAHPELQDHVWSTAESLGAVPFVREPGRPISDDNTALTAAGIPSVLVIDPEYTHWHTTRDDLSAVSARSLGTVGEVVRVALIRWFDPKRRARR